MEFFKRRKAIPKQPHMNTFKNPKAILGTSLVVAGPNERGLYRMQGVSGNTDKIHPAILKVITDQETPEVTLQTLESLQAATNIESLSIIKPSAPNVF